MFLAGLVASGSGCDGVVVRFSASPRNCEHSDDNMIGRQHCEEFPCSFKTFPQAAEWRSKFHHLLVRVCTSEMRVFGCFQERNRRAGRRGELEVEGEAMKGRGEG